MFSPNKKYDANKNVIEITYYESLLSKVIIENEQKYLRPVFNKINEALLAIIKNIEENYLTHYHPYPLSNGYLPQLEKDYPDSKNRTENFAKFFKLVSVIDFLSFYKKLFEDDQFFSWATNELEPRSLSTMQYYYNNIKNYVSTFFGPIEDKTVYSKKKMETLSELVQKKIRSDSELLYKLSKMVRPYTLFSDKNRGRKSLNRFSRTTDLGIMTSETTSPEFKNYFPTPFFAAKLDFVRDDKANFVKRSAEHHIPFISGASGSVGYNILGLLALDNFTPSELKQFAMGLSAVMVARGHHSFYEAMVVFELIGFKIQFTSDPVKFYEQFLTKEFKESDIYLHFCEEYSLSPQASFLNI